MAKSQCVVMSILASEYQSLILRIKELEEIVAELKRDNEEKAKIIAEQAKQIEELKAKLAISRICYCLLAFNHESLSGSSSTCHII